MQVVVQWISTSWTKRSRGEPAATLRNAVPDGLPLPDLTMPLLHRVTAREADGFLLHEEVSHELPHRQVVLQPVDDGLRVQVEPPFGVPVRPHRPHIILGPNDWVRWQINSRSSTASGMGDWYYVSHTFNIGYGDIEAAAFCGESPHLIDERGFLR